MYQNNTWTFGTKISLHGISMKELLASCVSYWVLGCLYKLGASVGGCLTRVLLFGLYWGPVVFGNSNFMAAGRTGGPVRYLQKKAGNNPKSGILATTPRLPLKTPQLPSDKADEALLGVTLGGAGGEPWDQLVGRGHKHHMDIRILHLCSKAQDRRDCRNRGL